MRALLVVVGASLVAACGGSAPAGCPSVAGRWTGPSDPSQSTSTVCGTYTFDVTQTGCNIVIAGAFTLDPPLDLVIDAEGRGTATRGDGGSSTLSVDFDPGAPSRVTGSSAGETCVFIVSPQ